MNLTRILNAIVLIGFGFIAGALTQACADMGQERQAALSAHEYCTPLYDQPGIERVQCDPVDGAQ